MKRSAVFVCVVSVSYMDFYLFAQVLARSLLCYVWV